MKSRDRKIAKALDKKLESFEKKGCLLLGIENKQQRQVFLQQLIDSIRRVKYVSVVRNRDISPKRADPSSDFFDPVKAAILCQRNGQIEEAFWFVFLFVHFGRNLKTGYRLARDIYGALGKTGHWTWARVSTNPKKFRKWLEKNRETLEGGDGVCRHFGNHRKYESLGGLSTNGTGEAFESYVKWVNPPRIHLDFFDQIIKENNGNPRDSFNALYRSMNKVTRFGRMAKFDYLTMVGKLGLAPIEPGSTYMQGATGPLPGARLLFGGRTDADISRNELDDRLVALGSALKVGMQEMEDSLCNWQKSPTVFKRFRG